MKVIANTSFVGRYDNNKKRISVSKGDIFELPPGTDWLSCGHVSEYKKDTLEETKKPRPKRRGRPRKATQKTGEKAISA